GPPPPGSKAGRGKGAAPGRETPRRPADPGAAVAATEGRAPDDEGGPALPRGQATFAGETCGERSARGLAPGAGPRSVDPRAVRRHRRPRPPQGHPGPLPAV